MSNIKRKNIRFQKEPADKTPERLEEELKKIKGVNKAEVDFGSGEISVEYDLLNVTQEDIERHIINLGFVLDMGLRERFKRGWIHFTEENERDNLLTKPHSCCTDPTESHESRERK